VADRDLRARFREGDPDAVREVYRSHGRLVYAVAYKVLGDRGLAEEATQQTFVKAWRAAQSFDEQRELGPWLAAIARRVAIDLYRR
jgi:RNA polymerase sigma-70 factor (ECF subfamily)